MSEQRPPARLRARLLLVEDSARIQAALHLSLESMPGLQLMGIAGTAADAMAAFAAHQPDTVILDIGLRVGSGMEVLREIKRRAPACRVVVFTGYDEEPYRTHCLAAGADFFFSKKRQHRELIQQLRQFNGAVARGCPASASPNPTHEFTTTLSNGN